MTVVCPMNFFSPGCPLVTRHLESVQYMSMPDRSSHVYGLVDSWVRLRPQSFSLDWNLLYLITGSTIGDNDDDDDNDGENDPSQMFFQKPKLRPFFGRYVLMASGSCYHYTVLLLFNYSLAFSKINTNNFNLFSCENSHCLLKDSFKNVIDNRFPDHILNIFCTFHSANNWSKNQPGMHISGLHYNLRRPNDRYPANLIACKLANSEDYNPNPFEPNVQGLQSLIRLPTSKLRQLLRHWRQAKYLFKWKKQN